MSTFALTTSTLSAAWRTANPEIAAGALLTIDAITDNWAKRIVGRAKRRFELATNPHPPAIGDETQYITKACQSSSLKGFCFVAADEIAMDLSSRGVSAKCVRVAPKQGGGDHYFTVVNKGSAKSSLIIDATWLQFSLAGNPFCLSGTLDKLKASLKHTNASIDLVDAYSAGLGVLKQWAAYNCFQ
jgi:hypothetical protein